MQLSDAEWIVMNFVWEAQPVEASDAIAALGVSNGWSGATVKTMLHRLVKKGALAAEPIGKRYRYTAAVLRSACVKKASRSFLDHVFGGDCVPALMHFVKTSKLSEDELDQLRQLLETQSSRKDSKEQGNRE